MKNEKRPDAIPTEPTEHVANIDELPGMAEFFAKAALTGLRERHEDAEQLFWLLARYLRAGTLHKHHDLTEYLASACDAIASGANPKKALGLPGRGVRKSDKKREQGRTVAYSVIHARRTWPDKSLVEVCELIASEAARHGIHVSDKAVEGYYYEYRARFEDFESRLPQTATRMLLAESLLTK